MQKVKLFSISCFLLLVSCFLPLQTSAHILATDKSIGAVLHLNPDDDPIIGQPTSVFFDFKDTNNKFQLSNCSCTLSLSTNSKQISSEPLTSEATTVTFPERNVYSLDITGQSTNNSFQPFKLHWDIRASRTAEGGETTKTNSSWISNHIALVISGIILLVIVVSILFKTKNKKEVN